jgi:hypothetical protein
MACVVVIQVTVFDHETIGPPQVIGRAMIPLEDYRHQRVVERSYPLYNQQGIKVRHTGILVYPYYKHQDFMDIMV